MTEDDGEWFADPEHHWQSNVVNCVVSRLLPLHSITEYVRSRISKVKLKSDRAFKSSFNARHNSGSLMPAIYIQYNIHLYTGGNHNFEISASTRTCTTMATTIVETSEDDTSIFKQKPTRISCVKQCKINVTYLSRRNNATTASDSNHSCSLSFLTAGKLLWYLPGSYILPDRNPSF